MFSDGRDDTQEVKKKRKTRRAKRAGKGGKKCKQGETSAEPLPEKTEEELGQNQHRENKNQQEFDNRDSDGERRTHKQEQVYKCPKCGSVQERCKTCEGMRREEKHGAPGLMCKKNTRVQAGQRRDWKRGNQQEFANRHRGRGRYTHRQERGVERRGERYKPQRDRQPREEWESGVPPQWWDENEGYRMYDRRDTGVRHRSRRTQEHYRQERGEERWGEMVGHVQNTLRERERRVEMVSGSGTYPRRWQRSQVPAQRDWRCTTGTDHWRNGQGRRGERVGEMQRPVRGGREDEERRRFFEEWQRNEWVRAGGRRVMGWGEYYRTDQYYY